MLSDIFTECITNQTNSLLATSDSLSSRPSQ